MKNKIDSVDGQIIGYLRENGRISMKELGEKVHLTSQAVKNRIEKLEDIGVLQKYTVNINCPLFGYKVHAVIRLQLSKSNFSELKNILQTTFQHVLHIYQITGERCYVLDMTFLGMEDLHAFLESIDHFGTHEVNIILKDIQDLDLD